MMADALLDTQCLPSLMVSMVIIKSRCTAQCRKTAYSCGQFSLHCHAFKLKNAGVTYQRAMTAIFHDMSTIA